MSSIVFVFGSNEAGHHGAGAALDAYKKHGARYGMSYGHFGDSFAIPPKNRRLATLYLTTIRQYVEGFLAYTKSRPELVFRVTRVGCGLANLRDKEMAELFQLAPYNCEFDLVWKPYLGDRFTYWGTYE
jgi:hypothetical protein